ncbi:MAG: trigger factor [Bacteroidetes bacterium]|jgi:trigger factor|nr:trigger factor [Bacteroidota bacterium]
MPKVEKKDIDNLNAVLTVTLEKSEYEPKFKAELKKYRKQANMKGFRKGRTPMSVLKKMYGQSVLAEIINEMLQKELNEYLDAQDFKILGQPLPSEEQKPQDIDVKSMDDYEFKFDLGISPEIEVKGADEEATYEKMVVEISEEKIEEDLQAARKRHGERERVEDDTVKDNDMVKFKAIELEGDAPKEEGIETEFSLLISDNTNAALKEELKKKKAGDSIRFNVNELEEDRDEEYIRKYYLNLEEDDERAYNETFEATIEEVSRIAPAELNQEFFDKAFGEGNVSSEEEAREQLRNQMAQFYDQQAEALVSREIQERLIEQNEMEFPEGFLKRLMKATNEGITDETVEKEYGNFRESLKWSLIRNELADRFGIEITENDIVGAARQRIMNYFGGQMMPGMEEVVNSTAMRMLQDENQVNQLSQEVLGNRVFEVLLEKVTLEEKKVSLEEFEAEVEKVQAQAQAEEEE